MLAGEGGRPGCGRHPRPRSPVDVEQVETGQQRADRPLQRPLQCGRRHGARRLEGEIEIARGVAAHRSVGAGAVGQVEQPAEVDLEPGHALGDVEGFEHAGMDLAHRADLLAGDEHRCGARRMQARRLRGDELAVRHVERVAQGLPDLDRRRRFGSGDGDGEMLALVGQRLRLWPGRERCGRARTARHRPSGATRCRRSSSAARAAATCAAPTRRRSAGS